MRSLAGIAFVLFLVAHAGNGLADGGASGEDMNKSNNPLTPATAIG